MTEPIYPKNWKGTGGHSLKAEWRSKEVQENICPKCHCFGGRFKCDGICQRCGYEVEKQGVESKSIIVDSRDGFVPRKETEKDRETFDESDKPFPDKELTDKMDLVEGYLEKKVKDSDGWGDEKEERPEYCLMLFRELRKLLESRQPDKELIDKIALLAERSIDKPEFHDACNDYDFKEDYFKRELAKLL